MNKLRFNKASKDKVEVGAYVTGNPTETGDLRKTQRSENETQSTLGRSHPWGTRIWDEGTTSKKMASGRSRKILNERRRPRVACSGKRGRNKSKRDEEEKEKENQSLSIIGRAAQGKTPVNREEDKIRVGTIEITMRTSTV